MKVVCELLGPPAAGKSSLAAQLRSAGHEVVEEQLQRYLALLGPSPSTPQQALARQVRIIDLVVDAVARTTAGEVVVDVGIVSALAFSMVRLPAPLVDDLVRHALDTTVQAGIRVGAVCVVRADEDVLRRRAASDARSRGALEDNLQLAPDIELIVRAVRALAPQNVLEVSTDDSVDVAGLSVWIRDRAADPTDLLAVLVELRTRDGGACGG